MLLPSALNSVFGTTRADAIQAFLEKSGRGVQDFVDLLVEGLSKQARVAADSTANAFSNLQNASFRLRAAIGERLVPTVRDATTGLTGLLERITDFVTGTDEATRSTENYEQALASATTAGAVNQALEGRIAFLRRERAALEEAAEGRANYFRFRGRETDAGREYREAGEELERLIAIQGNATAALEHFRSTQTRLLGDAAERTQRIADLEAERANQSGREYGRTTRQITEQSEALAGLQTQIGENANVLRALSSVNTVVAQSTEETTEAVINQSLEIVRLQAVAEDARDALSNTIDPKQVQSNLDTSLQASDAYFDALIASTQEALESSETSAEKRLLLEVRLFELQREQAQARQRLEDEATSIAERNAEQQAEAAERQTAARIQSAETRPRC